MERPSPHFDPAKVVLPLEPEMPFFSVALARFQGCFSLPLTFLFLIC